MDLLIQFDNLLAILENIFGNVVMSSKDVPLRIESSKILIGTTGDSFQRMRQRNN